jgi:hypothetical protein
MMKISIQQFFNLSLLSLSAFGILIPSVQAATPSSASPAAQVAAESLVAQVPSCPRAMPVATFYTANRQISICQGQDDSLFFRSVDLENSEDSINVPYAYLSEDGTGFKADGDNYVTYAIDTEYLTIWEDGAVVLQEEVLDYSFE